MGANAEGSQSNESSSGGLKAQLQGTCHASLKTTLKKLECMPMSLMHGLPSLAIIIFVCSNTMNDIRNELIRWTYRYDISMCYVHSV